MTTMLVDPPAKTTIGVGFSANRGAAKTDAWKRTIGTRQVPARLAMLPEPKTRWDRLGLSAAVQILVLGGLILIPLLYPEQIKTALHFNSVEIAQPLTEIPVAPPPAPPQVKAALPKVDPKPTVAPEPVPLNPQQPHIFTNLAPKTLQPKVEKVEMKEPDLAPKFEAAKIETKESGPKRPREDVKVGNLGSGSAAPATVNAPVEKVQTGGFGDPNGIPGKGDPNHATTANRLGSPALPGGEGYGNGTGGKEGIRGTVASTGFGNGTANPPPSGSGNRKGNVVAGGFGDAAAATTEAPKKKAADGPADTPVDITGKPRPEYTAEGRSMKIEGDVVLDLVFLANGTVKVNRVISGLGHGLDENAIRAAEQIKFKPALREKVPVDFPARVRIEYRLAY